jgi:glutaminyl-tRNA synthetase
MSSERRENLDFIRTQIEKDLVEGTYGKRVATRFPPEPNGWLHLGHAKSICLNFGAAAEYGGQCHLRFDDTNPETEDMRYVESIMADIRWLGFDWGDNLFYASDYFDQLYNWAVQLIVDGKAYVDDLTEDEIREYRGTVTEPGKESPYRNRTPEENLDLFERMKNGEFPNGARVLRAKIDMTHPNMKMRDPLMYRIRHADHYRTGDTWCIYPFYDWAHGQSDAIEGITHSICTLEFVNNRELYDWYLESLGIDPPPHQYEFAKLIFDYTVMSKRRLIQLVDEGYVSGWDDPRMPTLAGVRRRGYTPEAIRALVDSVGVAKVESRIEYELLEHFVRDDLNHRAPRVLAVLDPLKVVITNYPEGETEWLDASYWPYDVPKEGSRPVPFTRELYIERSDFMETPSRGFRRLTPGGEVRLRHAYIIKCEEVVKDEAGEIVELRCTYDPETRSGGSRQRRVKGTIQWVSVEHAVTAEVRLYERLYTKANPQDVEEGETFKDYINPDSVEPSLPRQSLSPAWPMQSLEIASSLSATAISSSTRSTHNLRPWSSTASLPCAIRGSRRDRRKKTTEQPATPAIVVDEPVVVGSVSEERQAIRDADPALAARYARYQGELGLAEGDADMLTADMAIADYYEAALAVHNSPKTVANWIINEVIPMAGDESLDSLRFSAAQLGELVALVDDRVISSGIGSDVSGGDGSRRDASPATVVEEKGLRQISDATRSRPSSIR